jgi:uncharacterized protein YndB with AHSA1/START domain
VTKGLVAKASIKISAPVSKVWDALVNPEVIRQYMFGTTVVSDWKKGSPIVWKGVWKGKAYEDKGTILELTAERLLSYTHYSPLSGLPDAPDSYHSVTIKLSRSGEGTTLSLSQDNNPTEAARGHSQKNWEAMLDGLKRLLENNPKD